MIKEITGLCWNCCRFYNEEFNKCFTHRMELKCPLCKDTKHDYLAVAILR